MGEANELVKLPNRMCCRVVQVPIWSSYRIGEAVESANLLIVRSGGIGEVTELVQLLIDEAAI